jgi:hypothetical protein
VQAAVGIAFGGFTLRRRSNQENSAGGSDRIFTASITVVSVTEARQRQFDGIEHAWRADRRPVPGGTLG